MNVKCRYYWNVLAGVALQHMKVESALSRLDRNKKHRLAYVVIPGNPGCIQFYEKFAHTLCTATSVPVWGVSHTGHAQAQKTDAVLHPRVTECGLEMQIQHKIEYLQKEVFPNVEHVILIGHSIGCYIILQILNRLKDEQSYEKIRKGVLLFPTIERMKETPQGMRLTPLVSNARWIFMLVVGILRIFPSSFISWLSGIFTKVSFFIFTCLECNTKHYCFFSRKKNAFCKQLFLICPFLLSIAARTWDFKKCTRLVA